MDGPTDPSTDLPADLNEGILKQSDGVARILAQLYDWEHDGFDEDVALYRAFARRTGGPVLEIACGSGRVMLGIAEEGLPVVGIDSSAVMLHRAKARLERAGLAADLVAGDITLDLPSGPFGLILAPLDGFGLVPNTELQIALLRRVAGLLSSNGRFVFDLVALGALEGQPQGIPVLQHAGFSEELDAQATKWIVRRVSTSSQTIELSCLYDVTWSDGVLRRYEELVALRFFSRFEIGLLLAAGGLKLEAVYGDYGLGPYTDTSERLIGVAARI